MVWGYGEPAPISVGPTRVWKYILKTLSSPAINRESKLRIGETRTSGSNIYSELEKEWTGREIC